MDGRTDARECLYYTISEPNSSGEPLNKAINIINFVKHFLNFMADTQNWLSNIMFGFLCWFEISFANRAHQS